MSPSAPPVPKPVGAPGTPRRRPAPTLLLTGFEPFGGESVNVSWQVAQALHGERLAGHRVVACQVPTTFGAALERMEEALRSHRPRHVLCLGQAAGRADLSIERVAINLDDAIIPDNAGQQPIDHPVVPGAPAAYFTRWPIKRMVQAARQQGVAASVSLSAGSFVCNHLFFGLMHRLRRSRVVGGFMHLPLLPEQSQGRLAGLPSMPLAQQIEGTRVMLVAGLAHSGQADAGHSEGHVA